MGNGSDATAADVLERGIPVDLQNRIDEIAEKLTQARAIEDEARVLVSGVVKDMADYSAKGLRDAGLLVDGFEAFVASHAERVVEGLVQKQMDRISCRD